MLQLTTLQLWLLAFAAVLTTTTVYGFLPGLMHAGLVAEDGLPEAKRPPQAWPDAMPARQQGSPVAKFAQQGGSESGQARVERRGTLIVDQAVVEELFSDMLSLHEAIEELTVEVRVLRELITRESRESAAEEPRKHSRRAA